MPVLHLVVEPHTRHAASAKGPFIA